LVVLAIRCCDQFGASGTSNQAIAWGDCETGHSGEPEYTLAAVDKSFNTARNYQRKTHSKKYKGYLNINKNGMKMFALIVAEEAIRNDPTSEGVVAPIMGAAESRAVVARRRKKRRVEEVGASSANPPPASSSSDEESTASSSSSSSSSSDSD